MAQIQFETTKEMEITLLKVKEIALLNELDNANNKPELIKLGLRFLNDFLRDSESNEIETILNLKVK